MNDRALMLLLPEVAYITDRVPIARVVIKPNAIYLAVLKHMHRLRWPLRKRCDHLGIPWHARVVPMELCCKRVLKAARLLGPEIFAQTLPKDVTKQVVKHWANAVIFADRQALPPHSMRWVAHHGRGLGLDWDEYPVTDEFVEIIRYLRVVRRLEASATVEQVLARAQRHAERGAHPVGAERIEAWVNENMHQMIVVSRGMLGGPASDILHFPFTLPFRYHDLELDLPRTGEAYRQLGNEMRNCISDRDTNRKQDWFATAAAGLAYIAVVRRGTQAVAVCHYDHQWRLQSPKGPRNSEIVDPQILDCMRAFEVHARAVVMRERVPALLAPPEAPSRIFETTTVRDESTGIEWRVPTGRYYPRAVEDVERDARRSLLGRAIESAMRRMR